MYKYNSSTPVHSIVAVTTSHGNYTRNMRHKVFTRTKIMIQQTSSNTLFALKAEWEDRISNKDKLCSPFLSNAVCTHFWFGSVGKF